MGNIPTTANLSHLQTISNNVNDISSYIFQIINTEQKGKLSKLHTPYRAWGKVEIPP